MKAALTTLPSSALHTSAHTPKPASASPIAVIEPTMKPAVSTISRSFCMKSRVIRAAGTAVIASMNTDSADHAQHVRHLRRADRGGDVRRGREHQHPQQEAEAEGQRLHRRADRETSPGRRTIARLTPSLFTLSSALSATSAAAYMP